MQLLRVVEYLYKIYVESGLYSLFYILFISGMLVTLYMLVCCSCCCVSIIILLCVSFACVVMGGSSIRLCELYSRRGARGVRMNH